jgi:hypothetical protein
MRNLVSRSAILGIVLGIVGFGAPAFADSYEVKFEQVSTNCEHPLSYPARGSIKIEIKGDDLQVDIDRTPLMVGKAPKTGPKVGPKVGPEVGKISAKSPKPGHTPIEGMDGSFSVAGRITDDGMVSLVMVGEYQTAGRPLCTQSWNLSGLRKK